MKIQPQPAGSETLEVAYRRYQMSAAALKEALRTDNDPGAALEALSRQKSALEQIFKVESARQAMSLEAAIRRAHEFHLDIRRSGAGDLEPPRLGRSGENLGRWLVDHDIPAAVEILIGGTGDLRHGR